MLCKPHLGCVGTAEPAERRVRGWNRGDRQPVLVFDRGEYIVVGTVEADVGAPGCRAPIKIASLEDRIRVRGRPGGVEKNEPREPLAIDSANGDGGIKFRIKVRL